MEDLVRRNWKIWLGVLISIFFLALALRGLHLEGFMDALSAVNYWWIIPGIVIYFGAVLARTWRWHFMLLHLKNIPLRRLFPVVVIGYMGNNVYPARAGEFIRSYILKRKEGVSMGASLTTVILERLFDGLVMLAFIFISLTSISVGTAYGAVVLAASAIFGVALIFFFGLVIFPRQSERIYLYLLHKFAPKRFHDLAHRVFDRFMAGLHSLRSPREVLMIFVSSLVIWLTETTTYWFVMRGFDAVFERPLSFGQLMFMIALANLVLIIPAAPGGAGTFDATVSSVIQSFGVAQAGATGYMVVLRVVLWLPITLLGFVYMGRESLRWGDFSRALDEGRVAEEQIVEEEHRLEEQLFPDEAEERAKQPRLEAK
jgi:glycosyltransferase 2 family protein